MKTGYNYRINIPSNQDIPYGVAMIIKEEVTHIDHVLQARLSANQHISVIHSRHPELNKKTIAFKGTVPDLRGIYKEWEGDRRISKHQVDQ